MSFLQAGLLMSSVLQEIFCFTSSQNKKIATQG